MDTNGRGAGGFNVVVTQDPDEFAAGLRHADLRYVPLGASSHTWRLSRLRLATAELYSGQVGAPTAGFGTIEGGMLSFAFRLRGSGTWVMNGSPVGEDCIAIRCRSRGVSVRLDAGIVWAVLYFPEADFIRRFRAMAGRDPKLHPGVRVYAFRQPEVGRLRLLVESAVALARLYERDARFWSGFEEAMFVELVSILDAPAQLRRPEYGRLIGRCNELLEAHPEASFAPADLCRELQVGERTLRRFFRAAYGQTPARFLRLRRLTAVRRALAASPVEPGTVTRVATAFGFCELGRFAADYRAVMGETPSQTMRAARARARQVSENA
jgi:AraC family ethanolamine operon transcriptional activator